MSSTLWFQVLYTHQKRKKRKTYQDGFASYAPNNNKLVLYSEEKRKLDSIFSKAPVACGDSIEFEGYLVDVDEPLATSPFGDPAETAESSKGHHNPSQSASSSSLRLQKSAAQTSKGSARNSGPPSYTLYLPKQMRQQPTSQDAPQQPAANGKVMRFRGSHLRQKPSGRQKFKVPFKVPRAVESEFEHDSMEGADSGISGIETAWRGCQAANSTQQRLPPSPAHITLPQESRTATFELFGPPQSTTTGGLPPDPHSQPLPCYGTVKPTTHRPSHATQPASSASKFSRFLGTQYDDQAHTQLHPSIQPRKPSSTTTLPATTSTTSSTDFLRTDDDILSFLAGDGFDEDDDDIVNDEDLNADARDQVPHQTMMPGQRTDRATDGPDNPLDFIDADAFSDRPIGSSEVNYPPTSVAPSEAVLTMHGGRSSRRTPSAAPSKPATSKMAKAAAAKFTKPIVKLGKVSRSICLPSREAMVSGLRPERQALIPTEFSTISAYKTALCNALNEQVNTRLVEFMQEYHQVLSAIDLIAYRGARPGSRKVRGHRSSTDGNDKDAPSCKHGRARLNMVKKDGPTKGKMFYACPAPRGQGCGLFKWLEESGKTNNNTSTNNTNINSSSTSSTSHTRPKVKTAQEIESRFLRKSIFLYCECDLEAKKAFRHKKNQRNGEGFNAKCTLLYLELSRRDASKHFARDDLWIVSTSLDFDESSSFLATSQYYGPNSENKLEIKPLRHINLSKWTNATLFAIRAFNISTEMSSISNIEQNVVKGSFPLADSLLHPVETLPAKPSSRCFFLRLARQEINELLQNYIEEFGLNEDQAACLTTCANMLPAEDSEPSTNVLLVHGVYGSGKSLLLAVTVLFLVECFDRHQHTLNQDANEVLKTSMWRILVSSTTNVAVDRILQSLLELGFTRFVRVGSAKKIAKPVLPYSTHGNVSADKDEIKHMQKSLSTDTSLSADDRHTLQQTIERLRKGENRRLISSVPVVAVTCAASSFSCLNEMTFPVVLLDECCQMTEPNALLPIARFSPENLIMAGDPKQLGPTVSGGEDLTQGKGLDQTLFDRLCRLGHKPIMLRTQYRCHPEIGDVSNQLFYDGALFHGTAAEDRAPLVSDVPPLCFVNVQGSAQKQMADGSFVNPAEAAFACFCVRMLLKHGVPSSSVGVICLYRAQADRIMAELLKGAVSASSSSGRKASKRVEAREKEAMSDGANVAEAANLDGATLAEAAAAAEKERTAEILSLGNLKKVQVSTVDAFQGGEKEVIIVSCVRSDGIGFIDAKDRVNVAITRAKRHLLILGHERTLATNALWKNVLKCCHATMESVELRSVFVEAYIEAKQRRKAALEQQQQQRQQSDWDAASAEKLHPPNDDCGEPNAELGPASKQGFAAVRVSGAVGADHLGEVADTLAAADEAQPREEEGELSSPSVAVPTDEPQNASLRVRDVTNVGVSPSLAAHSLTPSLTEVTDKAKTPSSTRPCSSQRKKKPKVLALNLHEPDYSYELEDDYEDELIEWT